MTVDGKCLPSAGLGKGAQSLAATATSCPERLTLNCPSIQSALSSSVLGQVQRISAEKNILPLLEVPYPICSGSNCEKTANWTEAVTLLFLGGGACKRRSQQSHKLRGQRRKRRAWHVSTLSMYNKSKHFHSGRSYQRKSDLFLTSG